MTTNELYHHGILGMKWGVRRYQNKDGSLTSAGKKRYGERNPNYSEEQRIRDRKIYGRSSERRIERRMNRGETIQSARHNEVERRARINAGKQIIRNVAGTALVLGGSAAIAKLLSDNSSFLNSKGMSSILQDEITKNGMAIINTLLRGR